MTVPPWLRLLRPHQYAKNLLVFTAPGAAGRLDEAEIVGRSLLAFAVFCAVSSAGYVTNDLLDVEVDRQHPTKKHRPLASGEVTSKTAVILLGGLAVAALALAPVLGAGFTIVLLAYATVSGLYSARLKQVRWLELAAVSLGFVLRAVGGGAATDTPLSAWFLVVISAGALLLISGKRLGELITHAGALSARPVLSRYTTEQLGVAAALAAVVAMASYTGWAITEAADQASRQSGATLLRLTAIPFGIAIARYLQLARSGAGEVPESLIVRDRYVVGAGVCWAVLYSIGIYL